MESMRDQQSSAGRAPAWGRTAGWTTALALAGIVAAAPMARAEEGRPAAKAAVGASSTATQLARGKHLVETLGCGDCHTPMKMGAKGPEPDLSRAYSGHPQELVLPPAKVPEAPWGWVGSATNTAFAGPWGTDFAANLTPDEDTGIGGWDADLFISVIRGGQRHDGVRPLMPPMPWPGYAKLTDDELKAVFAYLMSLPPVKNKVPEYTPPPGKNQ
jgi:mono/diheme cytochrome c family protein